MLNSSSFLTGCTKEDVIMSTRLYSNKKTLCLRNITCLVLCVIKKLEFKTDFQECENIFFCVQNSNLELISAVASHVFLWFSWIFWILIHLKCWVIPEIPQHQLGQYKPGLYSALALELIVECRANPTVSLNMHRNPSVLEVKPYDSVHEVQFWLCQRVHVKWKQVTKFKEHLALLDI